MSTYGDAAVVSGSLLVTGSATFNDQSMDVDFAVESDDNANMLFVDAGNDRVGIGTATPDYTLDVAGNVGVDEYIYHNGDADTSIQFVDDAIHIVAGGRQMIKFVQASTEKITINNGGMDVDLQVKGENNANLIRTDAANDRVGIGTNAPDVTLEVEAAAGDIFKMENTTAYGMTYGQLVKEDLTLTDGGSPIDTTLNLPAASMITDVLITIKTLAVGDASTIDNVALTSGGQTSNMKGSSFSSISMIASAGLVAVGTQYVLGNTDQSYPSGRATILLGGTADIKLAYTDTNLTTEPVVDVVVFYKKFDTS